MGDPSLIRSFTDDNLSLLLSVLIIMKRNGFHTSIIVLLMPFVRSLKMTKMHENTTVVKYEIEENFA